jgi:hypothetical protein
MLHTSVNIKKKLFEYLFSILFNYRYMFRSYDYLQAVYAIRLTCVNNLKLGCLHPVRVLDQVQVQGFGLTQHCLNTCLVFYSITATCFGRMTIFR